MDAKVLLVKSITLLYLNGKLKDKDDTIVPLVKDVLEAVKPKDRFQQTEFGVNDPIAGLRNLIVDLLDQPYGFEFDENTLKQSFKIAVKDNDNLYDALIASFILDSETQEKIVKTIRYHKSVIQQQLNKARLADTLKEYYLRAAYKADTIDTRTFMNELSEAVGKYMKTDDGESILNHPSIVNTVNFNDPEALQAVFDSAKVELDSRGVIKVPYQGLNRMMGAHGGIRRGETVVITALTHNYKSGLTMDLFLGCALFNKPYMRDPNKRPLNLRLSFENTLVQDITHMYPKLREPEIHEIINMKNVIGVEAVNYIKERLSVNGYENEIMHIDPTEFTYYDLFKLIEKYEEDGYEIHLLTIDYLNMMSKAGCAQGATGDDVRDLFRRVRNYCLKKGIALVTPHQFSSEARKVDRSEPRDFVKVVTGKGYYDGCSRLEQEIDLEVSIGLVTLNNEKYLTMQRGKHRGVVTNTKNLYTVYKFEEFGGIPMDVNREDLSRNSVGGETQANGGGDAWFNDLI